MAVDFYDNSVFDLFDVLAKADLTNADLKHWSSLFMTSCEKQGTNKIVLEKKLIQGLKEYVKKEVSERPKCFEYMKPTPFSVYATEEDRRLYVRQLISGNEGINRDYFKYLQDMLGVVYVDTPHLAVLTDVLINQAEKGIGQVHRGSIVLEKLKNVYYYVRAIELVGTSDNLGELDVIARQIKKHTVGNIKVEGLSPVYHRTNRICQWAVCPFIMSNYFSHLSIPEGFDMYYFEPELNLVNFLYASLMNCSYREAYEYTRTHKEGVLYKNMTPALENKMLPVLVNGNFYNFDGVLANKLYKFEEENLVQTTSCGNVKESESGINNVSNAYTLNVAVKAEAMIGKYISLVVQEMKERNCYNKEIADIFFLNTTSFAIRVKKGISLETLIPVNSKYFKKAGSGNAYSLLDNKY